MIITASSLRVNEKWSQLAGQGRGDGLQINKKQLPSTQVSYNWFSYCETESYAKELVMCIVLNVFRKKDFSHWSAFNFLFI